MKKNIHESTVNDFGMEWKSYDQSCLNSKELEGIFGQYFSIFPWHLVSSDSIGFDLGCGSGRWAKLVSPKVGTLHCIDPSSAIYIAAKNLTNHSNCQCHHAGLDDLPLKDGSMDFGYSLGVLHHVPNTQSGITVCVNKLKVGAPFLLYLYYRFDNKPIWFRYIWSVSNALRKIISHLPFVLKLVITKLIALTVYLPLARISKILDNHDWNVNHIPLSQYRDLSFYTMQTDALDRFGTKLEQRFTKDEIRTMMECAGLVDIRFSENAPFWCAVGIKK